MLCNISHRDGASCRLVSRQSLALSSRRARRAWTRARESNRTPRAGRQTDIILSDQPRAKTSEREKRKSGSTDDGASEQRIIAVFFPNEKA
jgi:hypothetical protein